MSTSDPDSLDDIDKEYQELAAVLAYARATEELIIRPNSLLSKKALFERYQNELQQEFATYRRRQTNGAIKLAQSLSELVQENPELFSEEVFEEISHIADLSDRIASDTQGYAEHIAQGKSLQEFAAVSDATIDKLYQAAKRIYEQQLFDDAADAFYFLVGLNAEISAFWLGLANAKLHQKSYKEALAAYDSVTQAPSYDPSVHISMSQCYKALGEYDNSINTLDIGIAFAEQNQEYAHCKSSLEDEKLRLENAGN